MPLEWAERQRSFDRPVLVVWAEDDRVMPCEHGRRLADHFPRGRLVEVADSYTLIPEDQPGALAGAIREFVGDGDAERVLIQRGPDTWTSASTARAAL